MAAWRVDLPRDIHEHPHVNHVVMGIDAAFPYSEPKAVALQAIGPTAPDWPHVEPFGNLCLRKLRYSMPAGARVLATLADAHVVLAMDAAAREAELRQEFLAYWSHRKENATLDCLSIVEPVAGARDVAWYRDSRGVVVFADDESALATWVSHRRGEAAPKTFPTTRLHWLAQPLLPAQFPQVGDDLLTIAGRDAIAPHLHPGSSLPVLIGCEIDGSPVFVAVEVQGISAKEAKRGFRASKPRPAHLVAEGFRMKPVVRRDVERADFAAVHGRSRNPHLETLRDATVAVIGCGALGGFMARSLAQAGVGRLILVDPDQLSPANVGRHLLGMDRVTHWKAPALAARLKADFPHLLEATPYSERFEELKADQLERLAACQLIVLAGIEPLGERRFDRWRRSLANPPALVWTWIEEFAAAGHAVGLVDAASLLDALDDEGRFQLRLTSQWPQGVAFAREAGCGVTFQPYSTLDMMGTVNVANRLALDLLLGRVETNVVRSWLGDRSIVESRGAQFADAFERSFTELQRAWPW